MKKLISKLKKLGLAAVVAAVVGAMAIQAQAQIVTRTLSPGFSFVNTNATSNVVISASTIVTNVNHQEINLQVSFNMDTADTVNGRQVKFYLGTSPYKTNFDIGNLNSLRSWIVTPTNGTTVNRYSTNFYVGSAAYFAPIAVVNGCTNGSVTNLTFKVQFKDNRNGL